LESVSEADYNLIPTESHPLRDKIARIVCMKEREEKQNKSRGKNKNHVSDTNNKQQQQRKKTLPGSPARRRN